MPLGTILLRKLQPLIFFNRNFLGGFLVASFNLDGVLARLNKWSTRTKSISRGHRFQLLRRRLSGRIVAQIPIGPVYARRARAVQFANDSSGFIRHDTFGLAFFFLLFFFLGW